MLKRNDMKYIDADKLIAEIKFAKSVYDNPKRVIFGVADGFRQDGRAAMCDDILKKIASLQQEQPEVDLEKEIKNYLATKCAGDDEPSVSEIARHFYKLGLNARKEEII